MAATRTPSPLQPQALPAWRRAVLKVGSNLLAADGGGLTRVMRRLWPIS